MQYDNIVKLPISKKANSSIINVPFHGDDLYVVNHNGKPYKPMKPIVEGMGVDWKGQYIKLKQRFKSTMEEISIVAADGRERKMICLALRKLAGWLQTINPNKVKSEIRNRLFDIKKNVMMFSTTTGQKGLLLILALKKKNEALCTNSTLLAPNLRATRLFLACLVLD